MIAVIRMKQAVLLCALCASAALAFECRDANFELAVKVRDDGASATLTFSFSLRDEETLAEMGEACTVLCFAVLGTGRLLNHCMPWRDYFEANEFEVELAPGKTHRADAELRCRGFPAWCDSFFVSTGTFLAAPALGAVALGTLLRPS